MFQHVNQEVVQLRFAQKMFKKCNFLLYDSIFTDILHFNVSVMINMVSLFLITQIIVEVYYCSGYVHSLEKEH